MDSCFDNESGILGDAGVGHLFAQISLTFLALLAVLVYRHLFRKQLSKLEEVRRTRRRVVLSQYSVTTMPMPSSFELLSGMSGADERLPVSPARNEYRAILENEEYQDLCGGGGDDDLYDTDDLTPEVREYTKPPKVKHATQWSASLESITEEDEVSDSSTSPDTYATYINNVNESPKIYHAGRVWCITKRIREDQQDNHDNDSARYLETDIDNDNDIGYEKYQYRYDIASEKESDVAAPTPTYILQGSAMPVSYPGHSQYLSKQRNDNSVDRPNFITTESGNAEWTYSFPIATDSYATALDSVESTVTYSNTNTRPVTSSSPQENAPIVEQLTPAATEGDDLIENTPQWFADQEATLESTGHQSVPRNACEFHEISEISDPNLIISLDTARWVETVPTTLIIPTPDLSPTIHRQDIPMESEILSRKQTILLTDPTFDQVSRQNPHGLLETDIDDIPAVEEKVELLKSNGQEGDVKVNAKVKGQKGKKFMDKFRRNTNSSGTKHKHKGIKNKENTVKRSKVSDDLSNRKNDEQLCYENDLEIDDDDDLRTINESEGPEADDVEEFTADDVISPSVAGDVEVTMVTPTASATKQDTDHAADRILETDRNEHESDTTYSTKSPSVRLLCCQAPRLGSSGDDSPYYLISPDDDQFHGRDKRVSISTVQTEVVFSSDEDIDEEDDCINASGNYAELINGIEMEPGGPVIDPTAKDQTETTFDPEEISDIEIRSSIRLRAYTSTDMLDKLNKNDGVQLSDENIYKSDIKDKSDDNISRNGFNSPESSGNIEPEGYASTNVHAFYLIGTPPPGNTISVNDVTEPIRLRTDQASCSNDMFVQDKQRKNDLDKENITPLNYTNKDKPPLLANNPSALSRKIVDEETAITTEDIKKLDTSCTVSDPNPKSSNYNDDIQNASSAVNLSGNLSREHLTYPEREKGDRVQGLLEEWRHDVTLEADDTKQDETDKQASDTISKQNESQIVKQLSAKLTNVAFGPTVTDRDVDNSLPFVKRQNCSLEIENNNWEQNSTTSAASDASERASAVITEQRARIRESLNKLNLPDWYKNSKHHKKILNNEQKVDYPDYVSEPRVGRSWSRSSVGGSDWSMDSSGTGSSCGAATKLSFLSEARYRRAYHNYDRYYQHRPSTQMPIRTAFSCAELPRRETLHCEADNAAAPEVAEKYHSSDALLTIDEPSAAVISHSGSPLHASSPNLSPSRTRSRSTGESEHFSALSIRRLEHKKSDAVFYITGKSDVSVSPHELPSPGDDSGFNDSFESKSSRYDVKEAIIRPTVSSATTEQSKPDEDNNNIKPSRVQSVHAAPVSSPPMKPPRLMLSSAEINDIPPDGNNSNPNSYQFKPITLAEDEVDQYYRDWPENEDQIKYPDDSALLRNTTVRPDPRYNPDGSRNDKVSPFPMLTQSSDELSPSSLKGSPVRSRRKNCNVRITITDTSMSDNPSDDLQPESTLLPRPKTPLIFAEIRDSEFAAVLSVVTSSNVPDAPQGNRKKEIPPPPEVTMEEIVDSLLGLSSSFSNADLTGAETVPELELNVSNTSGHPQQQQSITNRVKSTSLDSLFSDEGLDALNSIIIRNTGDEGDAISSSSSIQSTPRSVRDIVGDEVFMVKCSFRKCAKVKELDEARETYKTCHNCYTYYCSRACRAAHWERHKKKCLFSRINSAAKHVIYNSRYIEEQQDDLSRIARTGYLSRGRGAILLIFPDIDTAENYMTYGIEALHFPPTYSTIKDLEQSGLFADHLPFLIEMCRTYDPNLKFVLNVAIMTSEENASKPLPRKHVKSVKKCAKVRLSMLQTQPRQLPSNERETLILTAPSGVSSEGILDKKSRQICFIHIQRQLRQRGVNLRHQHSEIYDQLCHWVEYHDHFTPVTIYPREGGTGPRFMCVIMPDSDPNEFGWTNNPQLLDSIDLDAELEKLENVVSNVAADILD